jgi:hypothetical protein
MGVSSPPLRRRTCLPRRVARPGSRSKSNSGIAPPQLGLARRRPIGHAGRRQSDRAGAIGLSLEILADRVRVLGPDHPHTLTTRNTGRARPGSPGA